MKFVFSGDRYWTNEKVVQDVLDTLPIGSKIVNGLAQGLDYIADKLSLKGWFTVIRFPAHWDKYHKAAGPIRNRAMIEVKPDRVFCFHNDIKSSKGTKDMYVECIKRYIPVTLINEEGIVVEKYDGENDLFSN